MSLLIKEIENRTERGLNILNKLPHVLPHRKVYVALIQMRMDFISCENLNIISPKWPVDCLTLRESKKLVESPQCNLFPYFQN